MIKGHCTSNLDIFRQSQEWPTVFASVPNIGDRVTNGRFALKVVSITHDMRKFNGMEFAPYIIVELNK